MSSKRRQYIAGYSDAIITHYVIVISSSPDNDVGSIIVDDTRRAVFENKDTCNGNLVVLVIDTKAALRQNANPDKSVLEEFGFIRYDRLPFMYKMVEHFLDVSMVEYIRTFVTTLCRDEPDRLQPCASHRPQCFNIYDRLFDTLLFAKRELVENICRCRLLPIAAMMRVYKKGSTLPVHTDLPLQECSISVHIYSSHCSEFYVVDPESRENIIIFMQPGDAVIVPGGFVHHGRLPFDGELLIQLIMHYASPDNPYIDTCLHEFTYASYVTNPRSFIDGLRLHLDEGL
jgi:hypothetical protein